MSFNAFGESPGANAIRWLALLPLGSSTMKRMIRDAPLPCSSSWR